MKGHCCLDPLIVLADYMCSGAAISVVCNQAGSQAPCARDFWRARSRALFPSVLARAKNFQDLLSAVGLRLKLSLRSCHLQRSVPKFWNTSYAHAYYLLRMRTNYTLDNHYLRKSLSSFWLSGSCSCSATCHFLSVAFSHSRFFGRSQTCSQPSKKS